MLEENMLSITQFNPTGVEASAAFFAGMREEPLNRIGDSYFAPGKSQFSDYLSQIADSANNNPYEDQNTLAFAKPGDSAEDAKRAKNTDSIEKDDAVTEEEELKSVDEEVLYAEISKFMQIDTVKTPESVVESGDELNETAKKQTSDVKTEAKNEISLGNQDLKTVSTDENTVKPEKTNKDLKADDLNAKNPLLETRGQEATEQESALEAKTPVIIEEQGIFYDGKLRNAEREKLSAGNKTKEDFLKDDGTSLERAGEVLLSSAETSVKAKVKGEEKKGEGRLEEKDGTVKKRKVSYEYQTKTDNSVTASVQNDEVSTKSSTSGKEIEIVVNLKSEAKSSQGGEQRILDSRLTTSTENFLARELHQNLNGDIVRQASVVLREGGAGTIRLALKPESLGQVKIHLEMTDNKVSGTIVVESEEALRAFRQELKSLEESFTASGFDTANLNLQLAGGDSGQNEPRQTSEQIASGAGRYAASLESASGGEAENGDYYIDDRSSNGVNVLV
jgi:flagellar hook-length control protein FliK